MATLEELVVRLEADNAKLVSALEESAKVTAKSSKQMEDAIATFTQSASKETSKFGNVMTVFAGTTLANLATKAAEMAAQAFSVLSSEFTKGIAESGQFEQQMVRLANSMTMTGQFSASAAKDLEGWIGSMEELSGVDDAVIAGNLAMLSSMTKLDAEGLKRAQESAINLSSALGIDLNTATKMVGKAAEGSTDGFKKYGIVIDEAADKGLTFANTLKAIDSRFAGAAGGAMKTFEGSVLALKNSWGNLFQAIGDVIVRNPAVIAAINEITKMVSGLAKGVTDNAGVWRKDFAEAMNNTIVIMAVVAKGSEELVRVMVAGFKVIWVGVQTVIDAFQALGNVLTGDFEGASKSFDETMDAVQSLQDTTDKGGNAISDTLIKVAEATTEATRTMSTSMEAVKPTIKSTGAVMQELTWIQQKQKEASKEFATSLAEDSLNVQSQYNMQKDSLALAYETNAINFEEYKAQSLASQADMFAQEQAMLESALASKQITDTQYQLAKTQLETQQHAARAKMEQEFSKQRIENVKSSLGTIATLAQSNNKELASIGKAAAIAQATIDGVLAVQKAWAQGGAFGAVLAAGVAAATAANIAKISGVGLASGIDSVPGVGSRDNFPAVLAPGERVVPAETNKDLTDFLSRQQEQQAQSPVFNLNFYGPVWGSKAEAGAEIVEAINEALARGMSLRILTT